MRCADAQTGNLSVHSSATISAVHRIRHICDQRGRAAVLHHIGKDQRRRCQEKHCPSDRKYDQGAPIWPYLGSGPNRDTQPASRLGPRQYAREQQSSKWTSNKCCTSSQSINALRLGALVGVWVSLRMLSDHRARDRVPPWPQNDLLGKASTCAES